MKKKSLLNRSIKVLCLLLSLILLVNCSTFLLTNYDYNRTILEGFYLEPENSLDVVLLGASEVKVGFSSTYAYEKFGFTSYPYVLNSNSAVMLESQMREILKRQNPKVIIVEINGILYDNPQSHIEESRLRRYLDHIPFSLNKVNTILETIPQEEWVNYFFPLAKYHSNWKNISDQESMIRDILAMRNRGYSLLKGTVTNTSKFVATDMIDVTNDYSTLPLEKQAEQMLLSFLDFCRENHLENVVFVRFPHIIQTEKLYNRFQRGNEAERIIEENGFDFINLERDYGDIGLDFSEDFYNEDHVFLSGQRKITEYLCRILLEDYAVTPCTQSEENKKNWETSVQYGQLFYEYCDRVRREGKKVGRYESCVVIDYLTNMGIKKGLWDSGN